MKLAANPPKETVTGNKKNDRTIGHEGPETSQHNYCSHIQQKKREKNSKCQRNTGFTNPSQSYLRRVLLRSSRSRCRERISFSKSIMSLLDRSIEATSVAPSRFHRSKRSTSALRRRYLVSIFSQRRQLVFSFSVVLTSLIPHVSPVRYS